MSEVSLKRSNFLHKIERLQLLTAKMVMKIGVERLTELMEITGGQSCLQLPFDAATPPPTIPTPRCPPCSLEKETLKPRSRMFLSVSIPYIQPPTLPPYQPPLFPLVSKKKVSSLKSQSLHPCFEFHASLSSQESYTSDYPFSCVV